MVVETYWMLSRIRFKRRKMRSWGRAQKRPAGG